MTRLRLASVAALGVLAVVAVILGCSKSDKTPMQPGNQFTITASAGAGGVIVPAGAVVVPRDSSKTFNISVTTGTAISSVLVDGVSQGPISVYTFSNVTANHTITASFAGAAAESFDSGVVGTGTSFTHVFPNAGSTPYFCTVHTTQMTGTVNVSGAGTDSAVVAVANFSFTPATVTIKPGGYVRWTFSSFHSATSGTPPANRAAMKQMKM